MGGRGCIAWESRAHALRPAALRSTCAASFRTLGRMRERCPRAAPAPPPLPSRPPGAHARAPSAQRPLPPHPSRSRALGSSQLRPALTAHGDLLAVPGGDPVDVRQLHQVFPGLVQKVQDVASVQLLPEGGEGGDRATLAPLPRPAPRFPRLLTPVTRDPKRDPGTPCLEPLLSTHLQLCFLLPIVSKHRAGFLFPAFHWGGRPCLREV